MSFSRFALNRSTSTSPDLDLGNSNGPTSDSSLIEQTVQTITDSILKTIIDYLGIRDRVTRYTIATSLATGLVGFLTSLYLAFKVECKGVQKAVALLAPFNNLINVFSTLATYMVNSKHIDLSFNFNLVRETITRIGTVVGNIFSSNVRANAVTESDYLYIGSYVIMIALSAGLLSMDWSTKDLDSLLTRIDKVRNTGNSLHSFIASSLEKLGVADFNKNVAVTHKVSELIQRGVAMQKTPIHHFVLYPTVYNDLEVLINEITTFQSAKLSPEQTRVFNSSRSLLNTTLVKLLEVYNRVKELVDADERQTCMGYVLQGSPGVGKSELAYYLSRQVAAKLGLPPRVYNISPGSSGKYFETYSRQAFGKYDEFGATRARDSIISTINSIISSDRVNLEGAFEKHQPCALQMVVLTANQPANSYFDFTSAMTEQAVLAMHSRLRRIQVKDELLIDRHNAPHRQRDFSHLKLEYIAYNCTLQNPGRAPSDLSDLTQVTLKEISVPQLVDLCSKEVAAATINHINKILNYEDPSSSLSQGLLDHRAAMQAVLDEPPPELTPAVTTVTRLNTCLDNLPVLETPTVAPTQQSVEVQANAGSGDNKCIIRLQGTTRTGKTSFARELASTLSDLYRKQVVELSFLDLIRSYHDGSSTFKYKDRPTIYIVNEVAVIAPDECIIWSAFVDGLSPRDIVILTTNQIIEHRKIRPGICQNVSTYFAGLPVGRVPWYHFMGPKWYYHAAKQWLNIPYQYYWDCSEVTAWDLYPGVIRRLGFPSFAYTADGRINDLGTQFGLCITFDQSHRVVNFGESYDDLADYCKNWYLESMRRRADIVVINTDVPDIECDVKITITDPSGFLKEMQSTAGYIRLLSEKSSAGSIWVSDHRIIQFSSIPDLNSWCVPAVDGCTTKNMVTPLLNRLYSFDPSLIISLLTPEYRMLFKDGILYSKPFDRDCPAEIEPDGIVKFFGKEFRPSMYAKARFYQEALTDPEFLTFTASEIHICCNYIDQNLGDARFGLYQSAKKACEIAKLSILERSKQALARWPKHRSFKFASAFFGAVLAGYGAYKLYKWLNQDTDETCPAKPNAAGEFSQNTDAREERYQREILSFMKDPKWKGHTIYDFAKIRSSEERDHEFYDYLRDKFDWSRSNSATVNVRVNSVAVGNVISPKPTLIDQAVEKVRMNLVKVNCHPHTNYGIMLFDRIGVTTAHTFSNFAQIPYAYIDYAKSEASESSRYNIKLIATETTRDLALFEVTDKIFEAVPSILKLLPESHTQFPTWNCETTFARCIPGGSVYCGTGSYLGNKRPKLHDPTSAYFQPTDYITFTALKFGTRYDIFRKGDCGLPLFNVFNGKCYLVGIHNATFASGEGAFAPLFIETILYLHRVKGETRANSAEELPTTKLEPLKDRAAVPNYNHFLDLKETEIWNGHPEIKVLGFNNDLNYFSHPKYHKHKISHPQCKLSSGCIPSPTDISRLTPTAAEFLPKDSKGRPSPLLAQTKKMFTPVEYNLDQEALYWAQFMHSEYYSQMYGKFNKLRTFQAINGLMGEGLKKMDLYSSAGPYLKKVFGVIDKTVIFRDYNKGTGKPAQYGFSDHPAATSVALDLERILDSLLDGKPVNVFVKDNPKVELLPIEDVQNEGKVRLFCEMDLSFNLATRVLIGDFLSQQNLMHSLAITQIGMNPHLIGSYIGPETPDGWDIFCTDLKRQDKNMPVYMIEQWIKTLMELTTDPDHKKQLATLGLSLQKRIHIQGGVLYLVERGNPSGFVGTTSLNSFCREHIDFYAYAKLCLQNKRHDLLSVGSFFTYCRDRILGDDGTLIVSPELGFTFEFYQQCHKDFGFEVVRSKNFNNSLEFCSRQIIFDHQHCVWFSRLKKNSILNSIYWIDTRFPELLPDIWHNCLMEASLWEESFFDDVKHDILFQAKFLSLDLTKLKIFPYQAYRRHLAKYIRREVSSPLITVAEPEDIKPEQVHANDPIMSDNWVGKYLERVAKEHLASDPTTSTSQDSCRFWIYRIEDEGFTGIGKGVQKAAAKNEAYHELYLARFGELATANADVAVSGEHKHSLRYKVLTDGTLETYAYEFKFDGGPPIHVKSTAKPEQMAQSLQDYFQTEFAMNFRLFDVVRKAQRIDISSSKEEAPSPSEN
nr:MAG: RNA helicase [Sanya orius sauteri Solinvi-like virus 1]